MLKAETLNFLHEVTEATAEAEQSEAAKYGILTQGNEGNEEARKNTMVRGKPGGWLGGVGSAGQSGERGNVDEADQTDQKAALTRWPQPDREGP